MYTAFEESFNIRYVKLHFTVQFIEDTVLPTYKSSALRGGMGEMLLRTNCVRDRECEKCDFESECIVRRTMYSKMDILPSFMSPGDSVGYVIECEDYREQFDAGSTMGFNLILFGKTIVYFNQFLSAFYMLGMEGLGKEKSRFQIVSVSNTKKEMILNQNNVDMSRYEILKVSDYVVYRKKQLNLEGITGEIRFQSPLSVKFRGEELHEFNAEAIIESACRRIFMLDCFEGIESNIHDKEFIDSLSVPQVLYENHRYSKIRRFSTHKDSAMYLKGIAGEVKLSAMDDELLSILLAGELVHIGKNTSFGFGRYHIQ